MSKKTQTAKTEPVENEVFVYLGPSIRGVVQHGAIFCGDEKDRVIAIAPDKEHVARLMIRDVDLVEARKKLKNGGNSLSVAYRALLTAR